MHLTHDKKAVATFQIITKRSNEPTGKKKTEDRRAGDRMKNQGVWEASRTLVFDQRVPRSRFHVPIWQDPAACCRGALSAPTARTVMLKKCVDTGRQHQSTHVRFRHPSTTALLAEGRTAVRPCTSFNCPNISRNVPAAHDHDPGRRSGEWLR